MLELQHWKLEICKRVCYTTPMSQTTVSNIYSPKDAKRSSSYVFNVRRGDIVEIKRFSTEAEAIIERGKLVG